MIRRQVGPQEHWLITQDDHARISGQLAEQVGNDRFAPLSSAAAILGIAMHDSGWPLHDDDAPTLNPRGEPRDVFESTREIALPIWEASASRATERDDYAGLLVSLHGLALSVFASEHSPLPGGGWDMSSPRARFELNRFQHQMIELQESLRQRLGMRTDRPLKNGLSAESSDPKEQRLVFDFRWLQALDRLSLAICCTTPPFAAMEPVHPRPGEPPISIAISRPSPEALRVPAWPFATNSLKVNIPFRRLRADRWPDVESFRAGFRAAAVEQFTVTIEPHTI